MTIEERLAKLERKNRMLTLVLFLALAGSTVSVMVVSGWALNRAVSNGVALIPDEVKAHGFTLVGTRGEIRAMLSVDEEDGSTFRLCDQKGEARVMLNANDDHSSTFSLYGQDGEARATLSVSHKGLPSLKLTSLENASAELSVESNDAGLNLYGKCGEAGLTVDKNGVGMDLEGGVIGSIIVDVYKNGPGVTLYDHNGEPRALLGVHKDASSLSLFDTNGQLLGAMP